MKAIVCTKSGPPDVLALMEVQRPIPADQEVLIKVHAATVTRGDVILRKMHPLLALPLRVFGVKRQKIPGVEFAGEVAAVGQAVRNFKVGDQVFGTTTGLRNGANAEFVSVPENPKQGVLAAMPTTASFDEAAALPVGGMTALFLLEKANIQAGDEVLVYGASGSVGSYVVQLARHAFDARVTGVCSTKNLDLVQSIGAEKVIDYTREDIAQGGQTYDVVFDAVGKLSASEAKQMLSAQGTFLSVKSPTNEKHQNLLTLKSLFEQGKLKPVIDRRYPLEGVAKAHRYVETGRKRGNVVIIVVEQESGEKV